MPPAERDALLISECAGDDGLRAEVESLLTHHDRANPLDAGEAGSFAGRVSDHLLGDEPMPERIGKYTIESRLGEGGMGTVYQASQQNPSRSVALKVIKAGMDSKAVIARFEGERQALAMMDHPGIARVYDAGTTERGRPWFAMELVTGVPIVEYCDRHRLATPARLELFAKACRAIEHAHQKGVIHRDIKPSNVLVTEVDASPEPKIIDFGIAKATELAAPGATLMTAQGQLVGTPAYMSPEQARLDGGGVDTRSDIYSLGVLLYELLTGTTPFVAEELQSKNVAEMVRIICDEDPQTPSTRLSSLGVSATEAASNRASDPRTLAMTVSGDLDWIVMMCLEKDRDRRYDSAGALSEDIRRTLNDEPIIARPHTAGYKARKFVRRHRGRVVAGGLAAGALVLGIIGTTWGLLWALDEREAALTAQAAEAEALAEVQSTADRLEKVADYQSTQLASVDPQVMGDRLRNAIIEAAPEDAREQLAVALSPVNFTTIALGAMEENIFDPALATIDETFADQPLLRAQLLQATADTLDSLGLVQRAIDPGQVALQIRREHLGSQHEDTILSLNNTAVQLANLGKLSDAEALLREALAARRALSGEDHKDTFALAGNVGVLLKLQGKLEEAEPFYQLALDGRRRMLGPDDPDTIDSMLEMGALLRSQSKLEEALGYYTGSLAARKRVLGDDHPETLASAHGIGSIMLSMGRFEESERFRLEALEGRRRVLGLNHPDTISSLGSLASLYMRMDEPEKALPLIEETLEAGREVLGESHWHYAYYLGIRGGTLTRLGRFQESEDSLLAAHATMLAARGPRHTQTRSLCKHLTELYEAWHTAQPDAGHNAAAESWRALQ